MQNNQLELCLMLANISITLTLGENTIVVSSRWARIEIISTFRTNLVRRFRTKTICLYSIHNSLAYYEHLV